MASAPASNATCAAAKLPAGARRTGLVGRGNLNLPITYPSSLTSWRQAVCMLGSGLTSCSTGSVSPSSSSGDASGERRLRWLSCLSLWRKAHCMGRGCSCPLEFAPVKTELTHDRPDGPKLEISSAPVRDCGPPPGGRITPFPMRAFPASWNLNTTESFQLRLDLPVLHDWDTRYSNQIGSACGSCRTLAGSGLP